MPDLDILSAGISPAWARPYRFLAGVGSPTDVAQAAVQSLTSSLRRFGGFPEAMTMGRIIDAVASGQLTPSAAFARVRAVVLQAGGGLHVCMAARGAERLIADLTQGERPRQQGEAAVIQYACDELVANRLFDRARLHLIGERFASYGEATAFEEATKAELAPQITRVAADLVGNQTGAGVRAPRRPPTARQSTADQLFEPIPCQ